MSAKTYQFTKEERICSDRQIEKLFKEGASFINYPLRILWMETDEGVDVPVKILVSVSKRKVHNAVDRNKVKRLIRESYRLNKAVLYDRMAASGKCATIAFLWLSNEPGQFSRIAEKMHEALEKIARQIEKKTTI